MNSEPCIFISLITEQTSFLASAHFSDTFYLVVPKRFFILYQVMQAQGFNKHGILRYVRMRSERQVSATACNCSINCFFKQSCTFHLLKNIEFRRSRKSNFTRVLCKVIVLKSEVDWRNIKFVRRTLHSHCHSVNERKPFLILNRNLQLSKDTRTICKPHSFVSPRKPLLLDLNPSVAKVGCTTFLLKEAFLLRLSMFHKRANIRSNDLKMAGRG